MSVLESLLKILTQKREAVLQLPNMMESPCLEKHNVDVAVQLMCDEYLQKNVVCLWCFVTEMLSLEDAFEGSCKDVHPYSRDHFLRGNP